MDLELLKYLIIAALFFATLVSLLSPIYLLRSLYPARQERYKRRCSIMQCFGGGVFVATILLDLLPEVEKSINQALLGYHFPIAHFLVGFGFCLILVAEQIILVFEENLSGPVSAVDRLEGTSVIHTPITGGTRSDDSNDLLINMFPSFNESETVSSKFRSFLLMVALSLHSVFEGLAIGLLQNQNTIIQLFLAIIIHKTIISFSFGLTLVRNSIPNSLIIKYAIWFSLTAPLGLASGILLIRYGQNDQDLNLGSGVLQGIATGTFLYITFFEILPRELNNGHDRLLKLLAMLIGFSAVSALVLFSNDDSETEKLFSLRL